MRVTEGVIDGKPVMLEVILSGEDGCKYCFFKNKCVNPPVNKVMPCMSNERGMTESVYYKKLKEK